MPESQETATVGPQAPPAGRAGARPGSVLFDRYEVRALLGRGGHATVYRVYDYLLKAEVALKVVHPERDPERALARLRREAGVAREHLSPHLVRVFDLGQGDGRIYLTMEILSGGSLRERLRQGRLPIAEALRIAEAVLRGLAALHGHGVVHRDVTPGNILFSENGKAKLCDFGLVRRLGREETRVTLEAGILGTVGYVSPEQLLGKEAGRRSDLYAVGVVLFEMLTGKLPNEAASEPGLRFAALSRAPDVRRLRPEVPGWLAELVARLLERRPVDRVPSAEAALAVLARRSAPPRYRLRRRLAWTITMALVCLALAGAVVTRVRDAAVFSHLVNAEGAGIAAIGTSGERLWTIEGVEPEIADRAALARITPGGPRLLALVLARPREWSPEAISTLSFLDPGSGEVVKEVKLPTGAGYFPNDPPRFFFASAKAVDLEGDGVDEVLVNYAHVPEAPFYTVLYAPRFDQARVVFYSRGGQDFQGATDLDGDGTRELIFAGINNGWNWVNTAAAVRLDPRSLTHGDLGTAAAPDAITQPTQWRFLYWYAILPRGNLEHPNRLTIDEKRKELTVHYLSGKTLILGFDGFPPGGSDIDRAERQEARRATYEHLWEAERLRRAGMFDLALSEAEAALEAARRAREIWLSQYAERLQGKILVFQGRLEEAEVQFASLAERAEDAPEVAYDAAVAFHLHGDLSRAAAWYERGLGRQSAMGAGQSKHEFLKGEVLALVEGKRYADALAAVTRFGETYPVWESHLWIYREYVRWREGERPDIDFRVPPNWTDLERYWELEFAFAREGEPGEILQRVDRFLAERPKTRAELLSLRAEVLARLNRPSEASELALSALELVLAERGRSIVARAHIDLVEERVHRLGGELPSSGGLRR